MKKKRAAAGLLCAALLVGGLLSGCSADQAVQPAAASAGKELRIMSFNVAGFSGKLLKGTFWTGRVKRFAQSVASITPDSIGTQEMAAKWLNKLEKTLPQYAAVGVARDDGKEEGEYNTILYLKDKYELTDYGTFWLSKTPDIPSKYDENTGCNRICTYAVLKNKETGQSYAHINTHFDNVSAEAREYGAKLVRQKAESFHVPVVITGDFNCGTEEKPYQILAADPFVNTQLTAKQSGEAGTYHEWGAIHPPEGLDYCLASKKDFIVNTYKVLNEKIDGRYVSDHYAVCVSLTLK